MRACIILMLMVIATCSFAQREHHHFITVGSNVRFGGASGYSSYPIIGIDKSFDKKILIGGFSAGFTAFTPLADKIMLKGVANISRQVLWNEPMSLNKGPNPQDQLAYIDARTVEVFLGLDAVVHYFFTEKFSVGAGFGGQFKLMSNTVFPKPANYNFTMPADIKNTEIRPVMPVVPVEISLKYPHFLYNIRYEQGLMNRFKGDLKDYSKNPYMLLSFELGYRI